MFDVCRQARVLTIAEGRIVDEAALALAAQTVSEKVGRLVAHDIGTLICGAISRPARDEATSRGIEVIGFVAGAIDEVTDAYLAGDLPTPALSMPGCGRRRRRRRRGRGRQ